jgi:hypothetical protein
MTNGYSNVFTNMVYYLEYWGIIDVVLPFFLVFAIIYAVLRRLKLFGDNKSVDIVVSLIMAILTVVPHITGTYPGQYDPVRIINTILPSASVLAIVMIIVLLLIGVFAGKWTGAPPTTFLIIVVLIFLGYIFGETVGWWSGPGDVFGQWWTSDLVSLIIIILIFGGITWFITHEKTTEKKQVLGSIWDFIKGAFK